jgi:hypothetical protein
LDDLGADQVGLCQGAALEPAADRDVRADLRTAAGGDGDRPGQTT